LLEQPISQLLPSQLFTHEKDQLVDGLQNQLEKNSLLLFFPTKYGRQRGSKFNKTSSRVPQWFEESFPKVYYVVLQCVEHQNYQNKFYQNFQHCFRSV